MMTGVQVERAAVGPVEKSTKSAQGNFMSHVHHKANRTNDQAPPRVHASCARLHQENNTKMVQ
jgi:hypothetical protein